MNCVPLMSDRPSLRREPDRLEADCSKCLGAREPPALDERVALPHQREREMRERREIAARADRAARRHLGQDAPIQALEQQLDRLDTRAGVALRERVRTEEHRRSNDVVGVRLPDSARVAAQQAKLELLRQLVGDVRRHEAAETRVDAVRVLAASALDELPRRAHAFPGSSAIAASAPSTATVQTSPIARSFPVSEIGGAITRV